MSKIVETNPPCFLWIRFGNNEPISQDGKEFKQCLMQQKQLLSGFSLQQTLNELNCYSMLRSATVVCINE
jgi:hypothetical protein